MDLCGMYVSVSLEYFRIGTDGVEVLWLMLRIAWASQSTVHCCSDLVERPLYTKTFAGYVLRRSLNTDNTYYIIIRVEIYA